MRLALIGNGRMGWMIDTLCAQSDEFEVKGFVGPGACDTPDEIADVDVMIDFSYPGNLTMVLKSAMRRKIPLVIGTTGLTKEQGEEIRAASAQIPIVWADNFSIGVTVLARLAYMAKQALDGAGPGAYDVEIIEKHHNQKADAPSGTAKMLLREIDPDGYYATVYGREGRPGPRGREIGIHAVRGGSVAGEHSVFFFGQLEEIELRHRADSREIFARGALLAAQTALRWQKSGHTGLYDMENVLFG